MIDLTLKKSNILIIDDQQANIDVLEGFLMMQGYENIQTNTDPREVVPLFATFKPDLLLLDLSMPYLTGFEVMEQLKSITTATTFFPILVLTADVTVESKQKALAGGATDFLTKPFDLVEVGLRIKNLLLTGYLHQQLQNQNQILEEKVRERTKELEQSNAELTIAKEKAEASDRLKTAFMQNVSHEVRTPLNAILGFTAMITDETFPAEEKHNLIPMLEASCNRLINTITNYIDISLIVSGNVKRNFKQVSVEKALRELQGQFQGICDEKNINLELVGAEPKLADIRTDPKLLNKIVFNLIDNAVKFTNKGSVQIGCSVDDKVKIFVRDTGVGVDRAAQEKIFDSFTQEDVSITRGYEGSGVGLTVVKGFLQLLGGEINVESEKGKGSTFTVTLPKDYASGEDTQVNKTGPQIKQINGSILLIAEDDYPNRLYIQTILKDYTSSIFLAINGKEAVEICKQHPEISLVLMDIKMPEMNGIEATKEIRKFRKDLPIIAVSAYAMSEEEKNMFEAGCNDYLQKPINIDKLLNLLKSYGLNIS